MIRVERLTGDRLAQALPGVARLRIEVFRAFPYLYDGDAAYEESYLHVYRESEDAILVAAYDGDTLVGAATGTPMEDHAGDFGAAFAGTGLALERIFYCAESVLLPAYRGQGVGHRFFDLREAHARALGRDYAAFCSVIRPKDHPARPQGYQPLDAFWHKRGYTPVAGAVASFDWKEIGASEETAHKLQFWMRAL
ncbi:GNAT family N-acetyltransferase [uncultured Roseovarius sp.]|uniref:GNAT family N-acetyltransferase n=1 Tax=uncultured Roseovarius sp. TaxID=293344 RepID=UPI0026077BE7|nr:GNAT family N-acetyltransferase [uncultured Roseovarius sp.]